MTDGKVQPCRNNCGRNVYVSDRTGKWLPYNEGTDNKHDCPNYKKGGERTTPQSTGGSRWLEEKIDVIEAQQRRLEEKMGRIEELLEATLKNLGLFTTAKDASTN